MSDARIGSEIAGFRIQSVLGQGGMGTVYVAEQTSPRRRVVLKLLRSELSMDEAFRRRFVHESEAAASTEHPNIVPIYSAGDADGTLYIAMRYVEGTDLRNLIATAGPLDADRAVEIVSQVAGALDAAHARGLVHRDVKPGNILLDEHGNAYLTDFGLIKRSEVDTALTKTGQFMGSIEYCAPEQIRGEEIDGRADVYSLGCVLFESIAGRPPFKRDTEIATLYAHLEQKPPSLSPGAPGALRELDQVMAKAMAKRPADRYPKAGAFARDARHALGVTSGEREAVARRSRRRPLLIGASVVVVAAIVGALAVFLPDGSTGTKPPAATGSAVGLDSVVRLDPEMGKVVQTIEGVNGTPSGPLLEGGLAVGEGGVWIANDSNVQHVDPVTGAVRQTIPIGSPVVLPVVGFRTVWVDTGQVLERINPATDLLLRPIRWLPEGEPGPLATWIAVGEGAVWVASSRTVYEVDPATNRVAHGIDVGSINGLAVGEGAVWVIDSLSGELRRFDPVSGELRGAATVPGSLDEVAAGGGRVWVLDRDAGTVAVVDAASLVVEDTVRVGSDETDIAYGADALWLADGSENSITRIDSQTLQTATFGVGDRVANVAIDPGSDDVWALLGREG